MASESVFDREVPWAIGAVVLGSALDLGFIFMALLLVTSLERLLLLATRCLEPVPQQDPQAGVLWGTLPGRAEAKEEEATHLAEVAVTFLSLS